MDRGFPVFTAELRAPGELHAVFIRSPHARGRLCRIDAVAALAEPEVVAVLTGRDLVDAGVPPLGVARFDVVRSAGEWGLQSGLAVGEASFAGQPVAVVLAESPWAAERSAEAVKIDWVELQPALTIEAAASSTAPVVAGGSDNLAVDFEYGDPGRAGLELGDAAVTATLTLRHPRRHSVTLEPRACLARFDEGPGRLSLHLSHECPHLARGLYARMLGLPESRLRVIAPRVGGGFGARRVVPVEEAVIAWAALRLGRPVRWSSQRSEAFLAEAHEADAETVATMGFDASGAITALSVRCRFNVGARLSTFGAGFAERLARGLAAGYPIPALHCAATGWFTNTAPTDIIDDDGAGAATLIVERLLDAGARRLGMDPATLRLRNRVRAGDREMPPGTGNSSSTFVLERVLERVGYGALQSRFETRRAQGRYIGVGLSCYSSTPPDTGRNERLGAPRPDSVEGALVRIHPDGSVSVCTGRAIRGGDAAETAIERLVADQLGVAVTAVVVVAGDTDASPFDAPLPGTGSLRPIEIATQALRERVVRMAAEHLGVAADEVEVGPGGYAARRGGELLSVTLAGIAAAAYGSSGAAGAASLGLEATVTCAADAGRFAGAHAAVVEIDPVTGRVELTRYVAVDEVASSGDAADVDVGIRGSILRGIGRALREEARYRTDGALGTISMMTYPVPAASRLPEIETEQVRSRTAERSGVDSGGIATPAAIANAVADALSALGIEHLDMPYTPERVWEAIRRANQGAG